MRRESTSRLLAASLTAAVATVAAGAASARPAASEQDPIVHARTVVDARGGGTSEIFVVASGRDRRVTRNLVNDHEPAWSPDRRRIVYVRTDDRGSDIWMMRRDGTGARRLAGSARGRFDGDSDPTWSPDGKLIAFSSRRAWPDGDGGAELYVMRADGTHLRRLTRTKRWLADVQPSFSPDGRYLVYASGYGRRFTLYRIRVADGRGVKQLTSWDPPPVAEGDDLMPDWSPDGKRIAFVSNRDGPLWTVVTIDANGGDRRIVRSELGWLATPRWAPGGLRLLYGATRDDVGAPSLKALDVGSGEVVEVGRGFDADW